MIFDSANSALKKISITDLITTSLTTGDLPEGSNQYFTTGRVDTQVDAYLTGGTGVGVSSGEISIGQAVAKMALGLGMKVIAADKYVTEAVIRVDFYNGQFINVEIVTESLEDIFKHSDFITLHVPAQDGYVIDKEEFQLMKENVGIVNCARGGVINEVALIEALDEGKVLFAGLDVFEKEPTPEIQILMHTKISLTPHIGAATEEAQDRIGTELAEQIISLLKNN